MRNIKKFINSLTDLTNLQVIEYCERAGLQKIAKGSSRIVFALNNNKVIKIALSKAGVEQNVTEVMTWEYLEDNYKSKKKFFAKVYPEYCHKWDHFIVMERLEKKHNNSNIPRTKISAQSVYYFNYNSLGHLLNKKIVPIFDTIKQLDDDLLTSNLNDLSPRNFGYSAAGGLKMLDYGFSNEAMRQYYSKTPRVSNEYKKVQEL